MARSSKWLSSHKALSLTLSILLVFGLMFTFVPIAEAAPNIQSSVSTRPVDCNLSNGPLPDNVSTLTGGSTYYINLSATVDNRFKESKLYVQNPGDSGFSCVYDCKSNGYHRYTSYRYTAPNRSGTMKYFWKVLHQSSNQWSTYKTNSRTIQAQGQSESASSGPSRVTPFSSTQTVVIVTALNSKKALDADNAGANAGNGTIIHLWDRNNGVTQVFDIVPQGSGWYTIIHKASGKALDVKGGNAGNGVRLQLYQQNGTKAQKFEFYDAGNGNYYIRNALGYVVDLDNGNINNDAIIHTWQYNGGNNQKWGFIKVNDNKTVNKTLTNALYNINVSKSYITCGFDGYVNTKGRHEGIDFSRSLGSAVYSLTDGTVTNIINGHNGSGGLSTIAIYDKSNNKTVIYLHTAPISSLKVGASVKAGDKIATESYRGVSSKSSAHTHVEVRNGKKTHAAKSVNDPTLDNQNPKSYWNSLGYTVK